MQNEGSTMPIVAEMSRGKLVSLPIAGQPQIKISYSKIITIAVCCFLQHAFFF